MATCHIWEHPHNYLHNGIDCPIREYTPHPLLHKKMSIDNICWAQGLMTKQWKGLRVKKAHITNRPFYSCVLSCLAYEYKRGWRWPCFDTDLFALSVKTTWFTQQNQWVLKQGHLQPYCYSKARSLNKFITGICLAPWPGKINQVLRCDWLPAWARWSYLAHLELRTVSHKKKISPKPYKKFFIAPSVIGPDGWILALFFFWTIWTSTLSWSINTQKKNLANIQPSWPHPWSITHTGIYREHICLQILFLLFKCSKC